MKPTTKIVMGILTGLVLLAFIPTYDLLLKDKIDSVEVVVVKANAEVEPTEELTKEKLTIERRRKQDLVGDVVMADEISDIIGYGAADLLVGNSMVSRKMVDFDKLLPDPEKGEAIRPIINDMIFAKPGSLRRKDTIDIYLVDQRYIDQQQKNKEWAEGESGNEIPASSNEALKPSGISEPVLSNVKVVYVKDSSNKEVTSATGEKKTDDERLNATANISDLELILNEENFQLLMDEVIEKNKKLYITYN